MRLRMLIYWCLGTMILAGCTQPVDDLGSTGEALTLSELLSFNRGRRLFQDPLVGGNGRACADCHRQDVGDGIATNNDSDLSPDDVERLFAEDPNGPLFRSIDADDGASDFTTLRTHALVRVPFVLPPNMWVDETDSDMVSVDPATGETTVFIWRSTPSIENAALQPGFQWDARFLTLQDQAQGAVEAHFETLRVLTTRERDDLAFYQSQLFTNLALRFFANGGPEPELPTPSRLLVRALIDEMAEASDEEVDAYVESASRGRNFFVSMPISADPTAPRGGHCATCHSGPMLNTTNEFNPVQPPGMTIANNFVSEVNNGPLAPIPGARVGDNHEELTFHVALTYDLVVPPVPGVPPIPPIPAGTPFTLQSPDPGRILNTGDPCELPLACVINSDPASGILSTTSFFKISSLWAVADSAPYFHDNSAETLDEVVAHYNTSVFALTAFALGPQWLLSPQEGVDIVNYQRLLRRHPTLAP